MKIPVSVNNVIIPLSSELQEKLGLSTEAVIFSGKVDVNAQAANNGNIYFETAQPIDEIYGFKSFKLDSLVFKINEEELPSHKVDMIINLLSDTICDEVNKVILSGEHDEHIRQWYIKGKESYEKIMGKPYKDKVKIVKSDVGNNRSGSAKNIANQNHNWAPRGDLSEGTRDTHSPFFVINERTKQTYGPYTNISNCCKDLDLNGGHVLSCLRGDRPRHEGYVFKYVSETEGQDSE